MSFLNDSISYVLRGCILIELALRNRIKTVKDPRKRSFCDKYIEVVDHTKTGEVILDEALRLIATENHSISTWIDLLSGETWNPLKVGLQLRQVRERLQKGLVDKGILRTEKHSFFLFDMPTHPLVDHNVKEEIIQTIVQTLQGKGKVPNIRTIALVCAASAGNIMGNCLKSLGYQQKDACVAKAEEILRDFSYAGDKMPNRCKNDIVAGVLNVFTRMDSLLY